MPAPGVLSTSIRPPCLSTIARALASPRAGAGDRVALGLLGAEEAVEDARQLLLGDAAAGVGDGDPDDAVVPLGRDVDTSARLGELERVRDEVVDDLTEPHAVAAHLHGQPAVAAADSSISRAAAGVAAVTACRRSSSMSRVEQALEEEWVGVPRLDRTAEQFGDRRADVDRPARTVEARDVQRERHVLDERAVALLDRGRARAKPGEAHGLLIGSGPRPG